MTLAREGNRIATLSALLDFYSDRAVAHAGFLVSVIFGLFVILSLSTDLPPYFDFPLWFIYWGVWLSGLYCLLNFGLYARLAERIKNEIIKPSEGMKGETIKPSDVMYARTELIFGRTLWGWKRTPIKRIFVRLKYGKSQFEEKVKKYEAEGLKLSNLLISFYFLFALSTSIMFFTELSYNVWILIFYTGASALFVCDLITIMRAWLVQNWLKMVLILF